MTDSKDIYLADLKPDKIREAALAEVQEQGILTVHYQTYELVAKRLGSSMGNLRSTYQWDRPKEQDKFTGRVDRALKALADEGKIRRASPRDKMRGPSGFYVRSLTYYTIAKWDETVQAYQDKAREKADEAARWERIAARLGELGYLMTDKKVGAHTWEQILERLEREAMV
jgi:hypothetical protein